MQKYILTISFLLTLIATPAKADFNSGIVAYLSGDYDTAFVTMQALAETSEHEYAQYYLGTMYLKGQGTPQDYKKASEWFRKAAEQSVPQAQYKLGNLYYKGQGVPKDYESAYIWYSVGTAHKHQLSIKAVARAKEKLSEEELIEADKVIKRYVQKYGPKEEIDPNKPMKIRNE